MKEICDYCGDVINKRQKKIIEDVIDDEICETSRKIYRLEQENKRLRKLIR